MTILQRVACWISKATRGQAHAGARAHTCASTHSPTCAHAHSQKCLILIASPWQEWFRERASLLRYTYIGFLVPCDKSIM